MITVNSRVKIECYFLQVQYFTKCGGFNFSSSSNSQKFERKLFSSEYVTEYFLQKIPYLLSGWVFKVQLIQNGDYIKVEIYCEDK